MPPGPSLISPVGYSHSSCGYCSAKGERSKAKSSVSYGLWATQMSVELYEVLINRGWRRSGHYVYHPDMARTCCPQYTIRLSASTFRPGKHLRRTLTKFNRYILTGSEVRSAGTPHPLIQDYQLGRGKYSKPFDLYNQVHVAEAPREPSFSGGGGNAAHEFRVQLHTSDPPHPSVHALYKRYQIKIHGDSPASSSLSFASFKRFLCSSPLERSKILYTRLPSSSSCASSVGLPESYGTYHQLYWLDGALVAFAVLDILPSGVSSVYFCYDPAHTDTAGIGWGKVSALREASLVREMREVGGWEGARFLYLGYYIHSCTKMRYKGQLRPSELLDPGTNIFHPLAKIAPYLDAYPRGYFAFDQLPPSSPSPLFPPPASSTPTSTSQISSSPASSTSDFDSEEDEDEDEGDRRLPYSPPPPSFLDTRTIPRSVISQVRVLIPGQGYTNYQDSPYASLTETKDALADLIAALHGPGSMVRLSLPLASVGVLCMFAFVFYLSGADLDAAAAHASASSLLGYRLETPSSSTLSTQRDALRLATDDVDESLLSFSHIYVINLARRKDRRMHMTGLARALGVEMTFVDAITTENPAVPFILDRLLEDQVRAEKEGGPERLADLEPTREWPGGRTWREFALLALSDNPPKYPPSEASRSSEQEQQIKLEYPAQHWGEPAKIEDHWGPTACYLSHLKAWSLSAANNDSTALFLEDDVDVEFDLMMIWRSISRALYRHRRNAWHFVYLGWSWSAEQYHKPTFHPLLRKATSPSGTHAYVMSQMGVERARSSLMALDTLFQRPIDQDIPKGLMPTPGFEFFSVVPPLVVAGTMDLGTDIGGIGGTLWGGLLGDSALSRVRAAEVAAAVAAGEPAPPPAHELTEEEASQMMAVKAGF